MAPTRIARRPRRRSDAAATRVGFGVLSLTVALTLGACQKETPVTDPTPSQTSNQTSSQTTSPAASGCEVREGDVSVLRGGTVTIDPEGSIRAGLQYEVSQDPRTWKVMFLTEGGSISMDVKRGDTLTVAGQAITVRDACADKVVLTLGGATP